MFSVFLILQFQVRLPPPDPTAESQTVAKSKVTKVPNTNDWDVCVPMPTTYTSEHIARLSVFGPRGGGKSKSVYFDNVIGDSNLLEDAVIDVITAETQAARDRQLSKKNLAQRRGDQKNKGKKGRAIKRRLSWAETLAVGVALASAPKSVVEIL